MHCRQFWIFKVTYEVSQMWKRSSTHNLVNRRTCSYSKLWQTKCSVTNIPFQKNKVLVFSLFSHATSPAPFGPYLLSNNFRNEPWLHVIRCHYYLVIRDMLNVLSCMTPKPPTSFGLHTYLHGTRWYLLDDVSIPFQRNIFLIQSFFSLTHFGIMKKDI